MSGGPLEQNSFYIPHFHHYSRAKGNSFIIAWPIQLLIRFTILPNLSLNYLQEHRPIKKIWVTLTLPESEKNNNYWMCQFKIDTSCYRHYIRSRINKKARCWMVDRSYSVNERLSLFYTDTIWTRETLALTNRMLPSLTNSLWPYQVKNLPCQVVNRFGSL